MAKENEKKAEQATACGDYSAPWTQTFDLPFLVGWLLSAAVLAVVTNRYLPELWSEYTFFGFCGVKIAVVCLIGFIGGMVCRHFCRCDERGYIIEGSHRWFKVNYTRKLQHFAAYLVPLIAPAAVTHPKGIIPHLWETLLVMLTFLLLIKPIREASRFFMLQFNAMDRPEDRPNTLKWIILGNLLPALVISTFFQQVFEDGLGMHKMALLIVLIVGIGDGLAEPVGIFLGKRKYTVPAWNMEKRYVRSYAGSACVFISALVFTALFYPQFGSAAQFVTALVVLPPLMTFAEAYAPHSMDTPVMMLLGYGVLWGICRLL